MLLGLPWHSSVLSHALNSSQDFLFYTTLYNPNPFYYKIYIQEIYIWSYRYKWKQTFYVILAFFTTPSLLSQRWEPETKNMYKFSANDGNEQCHKQLISLHTIHYASVYSMYQRGNINIIHSNYKTRFECCHSVGVNGFISMSSTAMCIWIKVELKTPFTKPGKKN